ncbi:hypothetical protein QBC35DRAFT_383738 [Podospora australis]|uniref:DOMON domain-containing protein n=1 Tax=Podospora australis TaxID=1536484 RepID=A0AAN6WV79_9PEZI|nr:hypothetical protein QBC35DRAFT_383738 [Podospora australis]
MHLSSVLALLLPLSGVVVSGKAVTNEKRQVYGVTSKYCSTASGNVPALCYLQYYVSPTQPTFRIAIPSDASPSQPFDTILQIHSPHANTWAGFSWGGGMTLNPLTVAWPNGNQGQVTVSSRWSSGRTTPGVYSQATLTKLSQSRNSTHWSVEVACKGCSKWTGSYGGALNVNSGTVQQFAWAISRTAVPQPANSAASFPVHNTQGMFSEPLEFAKNARATFNSYVQNKKP